MNELKKYNLVIDETVLSILLGIKNESLLQKEYNKILNIINDILEKTVFGFLKEKGFSLESIELLNN